MEWLEWVIAIGGALAAGIAIWRAIVGVVHFLDALKSDIEELKSHSKENYLGIKRLTVMSHDMPIGERIIAGNDYIEAGGNGDLKKYIETELHIKEVKKD